MDKYLIDTNVFWELVCEMAGVAINGRKFDADIIKRGECFIAEITKIEIMSVMGKYARGEQTQWQPCNRTVREDGTRCTEMFFNPGRKRWQRKRVVAMRKLVKDILEGNSDAFNVRMLPMTDEVIRQAEKFIDYAFKYKFASMDAVIAATACVYDKEKIIVVTHDVSLRKALEDEEIHTMSEL